MKKQILTIAAILISTLSFSQSDLSLYRVTKAVIAYYNQETKGWDEAEPRYPSNMRIICNGNLISVTDVASSNYRIKETLNRTSHSASFLATDEKERDMGIIITTESILILYASDFYIKYYISKAPASLN